MLISDWLSKARQQLKLSCIKSYHLDAKILLKFITKLDDLTIIAGNNELSDKNLKELNLLLKRRLKGEPVAYLTSGIEFFGRFFFVDSRVLIPRVETEQVVNEALDLKLNKPKILDVGCGSGIIGITLALEIPESKVVISDLSLSALQVAKINVNKYIDQINYNGSDLLIKASDLLSKFNSEHFDLIVANLPYVDRSWNWININNLSHEPEQAIFAEDCGLILIKRLINQAKDKLNDGGLLILEMDPSQISTISCYAIKRGFEIIKNFPKNNVSNLYTLTLKLSPNFSPLK